MSWFKIGLCSLMNSAACILVYASTSDVYLGIATLFGLQSTLTAIIARRK